MTILLIIIIILLTVVLIRQENLMSANQEVLDAVAKLQTAADNIAADIQKLLTNEPSLSPEASAALQGIVDKLQSISDVVPG